jgi:hypothetical protein
MKKYLIIALLAAIGIKASAQSVAILKKDMYGIASDATEGRFTASAGYLKAAKYVEAQLKATGVKPGWKNGGKKTYLQPVPFSWDDYSGSTLTVQGQTYMHGAENFIVIQRGVTKAGKWFVLSPGDSVKGNPAGIILLPTGDQAKDWETTVIRQYRFGYMHYGPDGEHVPEGMPTILISPTLAKTLVKGDSVNVALHYRSESKTGYNVIGIIPGTDAKQAIVVGAHLDHIGRIGKHIYNGANDDASGCVAELGAARMLATRPGKRTVIFAFFCGEELNLKGSNWFADHLPVPPGNILMTVNLEQLGSKHRSFRGVWALGDTAFRAAFYSSGKHFDLQNLAFSATDTVKDVLSNTDSYSFMNKHIPSLLLGSGGFDEHHTPEDKIDLIDFEQMQKATLLLYRFVVEVGK